MGKYEYNGTITSDVNFDYFPFEVNNKSLTSHEIAQNYDNLYEQWKFEREISLLDMNIDVLNRPFNTLSRGEQTKILLAILFSKENNFLLIDEPTNHLDVNARVSVTKYLNKKKGFILVSHDRTFLDNCIDHVLSINRANIEVVKGNFSSWYENKTRQDKKQATFASVVVVFRLLTDCHTWNSMPPILDLAGFLTVQEKEKFPLTPHYPHSGPGG